MVPTGVQSQKIHAIISPARKLEIHEISVDTTASYTESPTIEHTYSIYLVEFRKMGDIGPVFFEVLKVVLLFRCLSLIKRYGPLNKFGKMEKISWGFNKNQMLGLHVYLLATLTT